MKLRGGNAEVIIPGDTGEDFNDVAIKEIVDKDFREQAVAVDYTFATVQAGYADQRELRECSKRTRSTRYNVIKRDGD